MASSYGTDADKGSLREGYIGARSRIQTSTKEGLDERIKANLESFDIYSNAELLLAYVSSEGEVDTRAIIQDKLDAGGRVALPCFDESTRTLSFYEISSLDGLVEGHRGVLEPDASEGEPLTPFDLEGSVCLVPGLVFDAQGHRVGYGGGYYETFLPFYPGDKIAIARTTQLSSNPLPAEDGDTAVDFIVTDSGVWNCD